MAVAHDATTNDDSLGSVAGNSWTTRTITHTATTTGSNLLAIVGVSTRQTASADQVSGITYGGQAMTRLTTSGIPSNIRSELWYLVNPPTGSQTVTVTLTAQTSNGRIGVSTYTGVDQSSPFSSWNEVNGSATAGQTYGPTITSAAGEVVVDVGTLRSGNFGATASTAPARNQRWNANTGTSTSSDVTGLASDTSGSSSVTMGWTITQAVFYAILGASIRAAGTSTGTSVGGRYGYLGNVSQQVSVSGPYYVSKSTGSDTNSGAIDAPWQTLQKALQSATNGSVVYLMGSDEYGEGNWWENNLNYPSGGSVVLINASSSRTALCTIKPNPGDSPKISEAAYTNAHHVRFQGLTFIDEFTLGIGGNVVEFGNCTFEQPNSAVNQFGRLRLQCQNGGNILVEDCYWHDFNWNQPDPSQENSPTALAIVPQNVDGVNTLSLHDVTVRQNTWRNGKGLDAMQIASTRTTTSPVDGNYMTNLLVEDNEIDNWNAGTTTAHADGLQLIGWTKGAIIRRNFFHGGARGMLIMPAANGSVGPYYGVHEDLVIENNVITETSDFGISLFGNCPGARIVNNTIELRFGSYTDSSLNRGIRLTSQNDTNQQATENVILKNNITRQIGIDNVNGALVTFAAHGNNIIDINYGNSYVLGSGDVVNTKANFVGFSADGTLHASLTREDFVLSSEPGIDDGDSAFGPLDGKDATGASRAGGVLDIGALAVATPASSGTITSLAGQGYTRTQIWPQTTPASPRFNEFVGAYKLGDGSLICGFVESTGTPPATNGSDRAPKYVYWKQGEIASLSDPYPTSGALATPGFDHWSVSNQIRYMRSTDNGGTWTSYRTESIDLHADPANWTGSHVLTVAPYFPQATIALPNGDWLRRVNGEDTMFDADATWPATGRLERLPGGTGTWTGAGTGGATNLLSTTTSTTIQFSRIRRLSSGVLIATGQDFGQPAGQRGQNTLQPGGYKNRVAFTKPLLRVSTDNGLTWSNGLTLPANWGNPGDVANTNCADRIFPNEWDTAELSDGSLLAICRTGSIPWNGTAGGQSSNYAQIKLTKTGTNMWSWGNVEQAPFVSTPTSGQVIHPELIRADLGGGNYAILFFTWKKGVTGNNTIFYTLDEGDTWTPLGVPGNLMSASDPYYPRSLQLSDGSIVVFGHVGADDSYLSTSAQKVVMHKFQLIAS